MLVSYPRYTTSTNYKGILQPISQINIKSKINKILLYRLLNFNNTERIGYFKFVEQNTNQKSIKVSCTLTIV